VKKLTSRSDEVVEMIRPTVQVPVIYCHDTFCQAVSYVECLKRFRSLIL